MKKTKLIFLLASLSFAFVAGDDVSWGTEGDNEEDQEAAYSETRGLLDADGVVPVLSFDRRSISREEVPRQNRQKIKAQGSADPRIFDVGTGEAFCAGAGLRAFFKGADGSKYNVLRLNMGDINTERAARLGSTSYITQESLATSVEVLKNLSESKENAELRDATVVTSLIYWTTVQGEGLEPTHGDLPRFSRGARLSEVTEKKNYRQKVQRLYDDALRNPVFDFVATPPRFSYPDDEVSIHPPLIHKVKLGKGAVKKTAWISNINTLAVSKLKSSMDSAILELPMRGATDWVMKKIMKEYGLTQSALDEMKAEEFNKRFLKQYFNHVFAGPKLQQNPAPILKRADDGNDLPEELKEEFAALPVASWRGAQWRKTEEGQDPPQSLTDARHSGKRPKLVYTTHFALQTCERFPLAHPAEGSMLEKRWDTLRDFDVINDLDIMSRNEGLDTKINSFKNEGTSHYASEINALNPYPDGVYRAVDKKITSEYIDNIDLIKEKRSIFRLVQKIFNHVLPDKSMEVSGESENLAGIIESVEPKLEALEQAEEGSDEGVKQIFSRKSLRKLIAASDAIIASEKKKNFDFLSAVLGKPSSEFSPTLLPGHKGGDHVFGRVFEKSADGLLKALITKEGGGALSDLAAYPTCFQVKKELFEAMHLFKGALSGSALGALNLQAQFGEDVTEDFGERYYFYTPKYWEHTNFGFTCRYLEKRLRALGGVSDSRLGDPTGGAENAEGVGIDRSLKAAYDGIRSMRQGLSEAEHKKAMMAPVASLAKEGEKDWETARKEFNSKVRELLDSIKTLLEFKDIIADVVKFDELQVKLQASQRFFMSCSSATLLDDETAWGKIFGSAYLDMRQDFNIEDDHHPIPEEVYLSRHPEGNFGRKLAWQKLYLNAEFVTFNSVSKMSKNPSKVKSIRPSGFPLLAFPGTQRVPPLVFDTREYEAARAGQSNPRYSDDRWELGKFGVTHRVHPRSECNVPSSTPAEPDLSDERPVEELCALDFGKLSAAREDEGELTEQRRDDFRDDVNASALEHIEMMKQNWQAENKGKSIGDASPQSWCDLNIVKVALRAINDDIPANHEINPEKSITLSQAENCLCFATKNVIYVN